MSLSRETVTHIAQLARLELEPSEVDDFLVDLEKVLVHVERLALLDTSAVEPTAQIAVAAAPMRPDIAVSGTPRELVLREAPRHDGEGFAVPAFVEEG